MDTLFVHILYMLLYYHVICVILVWVAIMSSKFLNLHYINRNKVYLCPPNI